MGVSELGHELSVLDVPHCDEAAVVARDYCFELVVVEGEADSVLVTGLDLLLSFEL